MACRFHIGGQPAREPVANVEVRIFQLALQRLCLCIEHPDPAIRLCQTYAALTEALIEITSYGVTVDGKGRGIVKRLARKLGINMRTGYALRGDGSLKHPESVVLRVSIPHLLQQSRSEERRVGKEGDSTWRSRWWQIK